MPAPNPFDPNQDPTLLQQSGQGESPMLRSLALPNPFDPQRGAMQNPGTAPLGFQPFSAGSAAGSGQPGSNQAAGPNGQPMSPFQINPAQAAQGGINSMGKPPVAGDGTKTNNGQPGGGPFGEWRGVKQGGGGAFGPTHFGPGAFGPPPQGGYGGNR